MSSIRKIGLVALSMLLAAECAVSSSYSVLAYDDETAFFDVDYAEECEEVLLEEEGVDQTWTDVSSEEDSYDEIVVEPEEETEVEASEDASYEEVVLDEATDFCAEDNSCGEKATWNYDAETGVLTISGEGEMYEYRYLDLPWVDNLTQIKTAVVEPGITTISKNAFDNAKNLKELKMPDTVKKIGESAFLADELNSTDKYVLPSDLETIGDNAFKSTYFADELVIPASVKSIGAYSFASLRKGVKTITFLGDMPEFGKEAFKESNVRVYYPAGNETWTKEKVKALSVENHIIIKPSGEQLKGKCGENITWEFIDGTEKVLEFHGSGDMYDYSEENPAPWSDYSGFINKIVFDPDITSIGAYAFYKMELTGEEFKKEDVVLPKVLKSIGDFAFYGFKGREIDLPKSVETIGESAFEECELDHKYGFMPRDIKYIEKRAFYGVDFNGNYATIPATVLSIGDEAFKNEHDLMYFYFMGDMPEFGKDVFAGTGRIKIFYSKDNGTWKKLKHGNDSIIYENLATYTVTFVDPYGNETKEEYLEWDYVRLPEVALNDGDVISGWYRENEDAPGFQTAYLIVREYTRVTADEIITARLEGVDCRVRFITSDDVENVPADQVLRPGDKVSEPGPVYRENHIFAGWYPYKSPFGKTYDFNKPLTADLVLYGYWKSGGSIEVSAEDVTYTGKALCPEVKVIANGAPAVKGRDYTVKYSNNVNAGTGHFTVTLKGNYQGSASGTFKIKPIDFADETKVFVADKEVSYTYDGKTHYGKTTVKANIAGKTVTLKENVDYCYLYVGGSDLYTEPGESRIIIAGRGNYRGQVEIKQVIYKDKHLSKANVSKLGSFAYTGQEIRPEVTVTYNKKALKAGEDFAVSYENNIAAGTATAIITAIEGSGFVGSKKVTFTIKGTDISRAKISGIQEKTYDGTKKVLDNLKLSVTGKDKKSVDLRKMDEESYLEIEGTDAAGDVDYIYRYEDNVNAGSAKVILTGVNGYQGTVTKTFMISPKALDDTISVSVSEKAVYKKAGAEPEIVVTRKTGDEEIILSEGTDYTVSYSGNKKAGKAKATVTFKGNFKGRIVKPFAVERADIAVCRATAMDIIQRDKPGINKPSLTVTDADGNKLVAGKDYSKKIVYRYAKDTYVEVKKGKETDTVQRLKGDKVLPGDIVYGVDHLYAEITGSGAYEGTLISETFDVKCYSIASAKVKIYPQDYNSKGVKLKKSQITVKLGEETLKETDFDIVGYENNDKVGTATVILKGCGEYGGIKKAKFKIQRVKSTK